MYKPVITRPFLKKGDTATGLMSMSFITFGILKMASLNSFVVFAPSTKPASPHPTSFYESKNK